MTAPSGTGFLLCSFAFGQRPDQRESLSNGQRPDQRESLSNGQRPDQRESPSKKRLAELSEMHLFAKQKAGAFCTTVQNAYPANT
ncbi:hypothetical protein ACPFUD_003619 [Vibrio cholerae]